MAAQASITIKDLDTVLRAIQGFPRALEEEVSKAITSALVRLGLRLARYPAERPGQRYVRTGTLGRGWTDVRPLIVQRGGGVVGTLENKVSYADLVQGERQAWMHQGRWTTAMQALDEAEEDIQGQLDGAVDTALRRVGLKGL